MIRAIAAGLLLTMSTLCYGQHDPADNPYSCEKKAQDAGKNLSEKEIRDQADHLVKSDRAVDRCRAAELYKRLGDGKALAAYEDAIAAAQDEPAYELFYANFYRLYRGAGQKPQFPKAEQHILQARVKLDNRLKKAQLTSWPACDPDATADWDPCTADRLQRSLTSLYERDGVPLAMREGPSSTAGNEKVPWLFFGSGVRLERATDDFDQSSDVRDLTSAVLFSQNCLPQPVGRLCTLLTPAQLATIARAQTPMEATADFRIRYESAPVIDVVGLARRTEDATINSAQGYFAPTSFSDLKLTDFGIHIDKPLALTRTTDLDLQFSFDHVTREGLIEFFPNGRERIGQYQVSGALSQYVGPDRVNLSYTYIRQNIDPTPYLTQRDRELMGATLDYQIFRRIFHRSLNSGLGRYFETRGIDLSAGFLHDHDNYTGTNPDQITRKDYFVGVSAKGLGPVDVTVQPTWYSSAVRLDSTQYNAQLRMAGNVLLRILDEERTPGVPRQRFLGMPVAFIQIVVPVHWDMPRTDFGAFQSRSAGAELWTKFFTNQKTGVSVLGVLGYSHDWFPSLGKELNLGRIGLSVGF